MSGLVSSKSFITADTQKVNQAHQPSPCSAQQLHTSLQVTTARQYQTRIISLSGAETLSEGT
jgi:hypothetical protein